MVRTSDLLRIIIDCVVPRHSHRLFLHKNASEVGLVTNHSPVISRMGNLNSRFCRRSGIISTTSNPHSFIVFSRFKRQLIAPPPFLPARQTPTAGVPPIGSLYGIYLAESGTARRGHSRKARMLSLRSKKYTGLTKTALSSAYSPR